MKKLLTKALAVLLVCLFALSAVNFSISADDSNPLGEKLAAMNVKIRGSNRLMFYFTNIDNVEFFEVKIPQANGSVEAFKIYKNRLTYEKEKDRYLLEVPVAAAQLSEQVTIQAFDAAGNAGKLRSYSIRDYANQLFALADTNSNYANAAKALESMLNYGAMAQKYFDYKTDNLANAGLNTDSITSGGIYGVDSSYHDPIDNIKFTGVSAYLEDAVSLRFYFEYTGTRKDSPKELSVKIGGTEYKNEVNRDSNGKYYVLINNIPASLFNKQYEVCLSEDGTNYASIRYSVFNYLQAKLEIDDSQKFEDLAHSAFDFYVLTNQYRGSGSAETESVTVNAANGFGYTVSGGRVNGTNNNGTLADDKTGFTANKGETITIKVNSLPSSETYSFKLYASDKVKVTVAGRSYDLSAGENTIDLTNPTATEIKVEAVNGSTFVLFTCDTGSNDTGYSDMSSIDFSDRNNLDFIESVNNADLSYDFTKEAAKLNVSATGLQFEIKAPEGASVTAGNYAYIEFTYMIPASSKFVANQEISCRVGANTIDLGTAALTADGRWHTAKIDISSFASSLAGSIDSLCLIFVNDDLSAGHEFYLKSLNLKEATDTSISIVDDLLGKLTDGELDIATRDDKGNVTDTLSVNKNSSIENCDGYFTRIVVGNGAEVTKDDGSIAHDRYVGFVLGGETVTGKYMVIRYRTDATPRKIDFEVFATVGENTISGFDNPEKECGGLAYGVVSDGKWHTLVIDLAKISADVKAAGDEVKLNDVRIDLFDCFNTGDVIDIAYIGFCEDINAFRATLDEGEYLEFSNREWSLAVDAVKMDEIKVPAGGVDYAHGANSTISSVIEGSVWNFSGWFAINGVKASSLEYCITEENGTENHFDIHYSTSGATRYFDTEKAVTDYVRDSLRYTNPNDAKRLSINADLLAYLGQTVTITIRAITEDGYAVVLYAVKVRVTAPKYNSLNYVLTGDELYGEMFGGDHDAIRQINQAPHAVVKNEDGTVSVRVTTLRSGGTARKWLGIQPDASTPTGKYMVIKYRTNGLPDTGHFYIYATTVGKIKNEDNRLSSTGFVGDGNWHTLVIDLSSAPAAGVNANFDYCITDVRLQMLDNLADGEVVDFEYIGFCDSINDIPLSDGEHLEYSWQEWSASVDTVTMDGQPALKNSTGDEAGASQHGLLSGGQWAWSGGWFAIDGQSAKEVSVCITEEDGTAHRTAVTKGATNTSAPNTWWEATDITNYVKTHNGYSESTVGYRVNLSANLLEFLGQTVTVSVRALTNDDRTVTVYSASVYVPMSATPQWITGIELQKYINNSFHSKTPNSDGSLTLSAQPGAGTDNYTNELQSELAGVKAPRYAIIRYKTTDKTTLGMYARTTSSTGYVKLHGSIINDGNWHTVVFDLTISGQYTLGEDITFLRVDPCLLQGESITIDYVYLCDTIGDSGLDYSVDLIEKNNSSLSSAMGTIDRTPEGLRITSAGFTTDSTRMSINLNGAKTGKYLVMTYRYASTNQKNANLANINVWTSTVNGGATGGDNQQANVIADGNWHTVVVDISKNKTVTANDDGTYSLKYLALDVFSTASACNGDYLDISYIGFSDDFNEIVDEFGETKYSVAYQLNNGNVTLGAGQVHSWMSSATTVTRSKKATSNITGFATVNGKITDVYYQIVAADGSTAGWINATSGIFNPGDNGYETYNSQSGTAQTIWLGEGGNIENAATFEIPASALEGYSAGDVITVLVAVKTTDMVEGSFAVLVSCTMTFTE